MSVFFSIFDQYLSVFIFELENGSIFDEKSEFVSIFHLLFGNKDLYHLKEIFGDGLCLLAGSQYYGDSQREINAQSL